MRIGTRGRIISRLKRKLEVLLVGTSLVFFFFFFFHTVASYKVWSRGQCSWRQGQVDKTGKNNEKIGKNSKLYLALVVKSCDQLDVVTKSLLLYFRMLSELEVIYRAGSSRGAKE